MVFIGNTSSEKCSIMYTNNSFKITGSYTEFLGYKVDSASGTNGIYVEWEMNYKKGLRLTNDKFGMFPIYYKNVQDGLEFSTSIVDLIDDDSELDYSSLAVFLRLGFFISDYTPFLKIKALPPGSILTFNKKGLFIESNKIESSLNYNVSLEKARNIYGELFQNSILKFSNFFSKKIGLPLSGGRDSRHILFELTSSKLDNFSCLTMNYEKPNSNEDTEIAQKITNILNLNHIILDPPKSVLKREKEKNLLTNFCSLQHSWILPLSKYLSNGCYDAIFDGIGGDVLSSSSNLTMKRLDLYRKKKYRQLAEDIIGNEGYLRNILKKRVYQSLDREVAITLIIEELKKHVDTPNPVSQFYFWNRARRHIAMSCWGILQQRNYVFAPYLEHELYEFLASLPAEYILDKKFHQNVIDDRFPQFASIPYGQKIKVNTADNINLQYYQLFEILYHSVYSKGKKMYRNSFFYPRLFKSLISSRYYFNSKSIFIFQIYLNQLANLVAKK